MGTWIVYAAGSNNLGGVCASIRWFVPLLAPAFYVLALYLREEPRHWRSFVALSVWGVVMALVMWWRGPWATRMVPFYWVWVGAALISWLACHTGRRACTALAQPGRTAALPS